jgi:hypothetical protein
MKVKVLKDFMTQELGDFTSGEIRNVPDWVARNWLGYGLVEEVDKTPVLLQSKPEAQKYEIKPDLNFKKRKVKKHESNHSPY